MLQSLHFSRRPGAFESSGARSELIAVSKSFPPAMNSEAPRMIHAMPVEVFRLPLGDDSVDDDLDPGKRACVMRRKGRCGLSGIVGSIRLRLLELAATLRYHRFSLHLRTMLEGIGRESSPGRDHGSEKRHESVEPDTNRSQRRSAYGGKGQILMTIIVPSSLCEEHMRRSHCPGLCALGLYTSSSDGRPWYT